MQVLVEAAAARDFIQYFEHVREDIDAAKRRGQLPAGLAAPATCYRVYVGLLAQFDGAGEADVVVDLPTVGDVADYVLYNRAATRWIAAVRRAGVIGSEPRCSPDPVLDALCAALPSPAVSAFDVAARLAPDGLVLLDSVGRIVDANDAARDVLGRAASRGTWLSDLMAATSVADTWSVLLTGPAGGMTAATFVVGPDAVDAVDCDVSLASHVESHGFRVLSVRPSSDRHARERLLTWQASHDPLSRLPNRRSLLAHLDAAVGRNMRDGVAFALLMIDIDEFKSINDRFGHAVGDAVLVEVAARLRSVVRPADLVARIGGDEFAVLLGDARDHRAATTIAERARAAFDEPIDGDHELSVGVSVGVVFVAGDGPETWTASGVLAAADLAMYEAKRTGRNRWVAQRFP